MRLQFKGNTLVATKEKGDPVYRNHGYAGGNAGESRLLYHIKQQLNKAGFDLVKVRMWRDGHMVSDEQQYLRVRKQSSKTPHIYIHNGSWQVKGAEMDFNEKGETVLWVSHDVYGVQPDCADLIDEVVNEESI